MDLIDYLNKAKSSIFRFEYLQDFSKTDQTEFEHWKKKGTIDTTRMKEWWDFLEKKHKEGVVTERVRNVVLPLSRYMQFEIEAHRLSAQHGDRIRIITDEQFKSLSLSVGDFWLVDDVTTLKMLYGEGGVFLGIEKRGVVDPHVQAKAPYSMLSIQGGYYNDEGAFEFIKDANNVITHSFFNPDP